MDDLQIAKKIVRTSESAKDRGYKFNISFRKMKQLMTRKTCFYTGVTFDEKDNKRSIDRVDNEIGYIDSNVVVCTIKINNLKNDLTIKEINGLYKKVNSFLNK